MCVHLGDVLFDSFWTMWKGLRVEDRHRMLRAIGAVAPGWQSLASMLKVFQFNPVWSLFRGLVLSAGMRGHIRAWRHRRLAWLGETDCWRQSLCFTASLAFTLQAAKSRRRVSRTWAMCKSMVAKLLRYAGYIRVRCSEVEQPVVVPQREREREQSPSTGTRSVIAPWLAATFGPRSMDGGTMSNGSPMKIVCAHLNL